MEKQKVFLTGATGNMGFAGMKLLLEDTAEMDLVILARPSEIDKKLLEPFLKTKGLTIVWGDLTNYEDIKTCVKDADIILHVGAFVSPAADYYPEQAMKVNYGSVVSIIKAIKELEQENKTGLVYIGTVAETGDRMPPIHWGRVGDPLKPSVFDYYAVSKIAAERCVIESEITKWVSLRQTGIIGSGMVDIEDAIMFHNCLDNVLEYVSDKDSAILLRNLCRKERKKQLDNTFWGHVFNIGGGESCRASTYDMYKNIFSEMGIKNLSYMFESKWFATRNFHGQYYLDSDKLNNILEFRNDGLDYLYNLYLENLGSGSFWTKTIAKVPGGEKLIANIVKKRFSKLLNLEHGTMNFIENNMEEHIISYWGSKEAWNNIPPMDKFEPFNDWDTVIHIDHGYNENKPEDQLDLADMKNAAKFRGGECLSSQINTGNWTEKLQFKCAFNHNFEASPRLVLEGGHWCPVCEQESWNYYERAKLDPFFAQVWDPLHPKNEKGLVYPKIVSEDNLK